MGPLPRIGRPLDLSLLQLAILITAAFLAGVVDAIAGGGGLITVPALLAAGLPPHVALGTNKGQSVFGAAAALANFARAGLVERRLAVATFPAGLLGSFAGAGLVLLVRPEILRPAVLVLLVAVALFLAFRPRVARAAPPPPRRAAILATLLALCVGAYDGFFGPGTGTFLIVGFVGLLGMEMARASANAKVINFASNLAAVILFAAQGLILWQVALPMAAAQFAGGVAGSQLAVRGGDGLVRRVVLLVVLVLAVKLGHDLWTA